MMDENNVVNPWRGLLVLPPDAAFSVARAAARAGQARLDRKAAQAASDARKAQKKVKR